jgi:chlorophyll(ide) b reductase
MSNGGVVITGSAGGVGFAYAGEFMDRGYDVVICDVKDCTAAARALAQRHPNGKVFHTQCDVSDAKSVEKLAAFAKKNLGTVNYWINNAGVNGGRRDLRDVPISQVELVVKVNLLGVLLCTKAAMEIMGEQVSAISSILSLYVGCGRKSQNSHCCDPCHQILFVVRLVSLVTFSTRWEVVSRVVVPLDTLAMVPPNVDCRN